MASKEQVNMSPNQAIGDARDSTM